MPPAVSATVSAPPVDDATSNVTAAGPVPGSEAQVSLAYASW